MLVLGGQLHDALGQRPQLLHRLGPRHQRLAARLVGERHRDLRADHARQRLHRVALQRGEVIKAIEEHGLGSPAMRLRAQGIQGPPRIELAVHPAEAVELAHVVAVQAAHLVGVGRPPDVLSRPGAQAGDEPPRIHERALQLGDQLAGGGGEARGRRGSPQHVEPGAGDHALEDPLALQLGDAAAGVLRPPRDLIGQAAEGEHRAEHHPVAGQLAGVMARVDGGGHDEDGAAAGGVRVGAEDGPRLGGVGGAEDEGEGHPPNTGARPRRLDDGTAVRPRRTARRGRRRPRHHRRRRAPRTRAAWRPPWPRARRTRRATCPLRSA